mgnify:CR=1 FL=1
MKHWGRGSSWVRGLAALLAPIAPFVSLIPEVFLLHSPQIAVRLRWAVLLSAPLVLVGIVQWLAVREEAGIAFLSIGLTLAAFITFAPSQRRPLYVGSLSFLALALVASLAFLYIDRNLWQSTAGSGLMGLVDQIRRPGLVEGRPNARVAAFRKWSLKDSVGGPSELAVTVRLIEGEPGFAWNTSEPRVVRLDVETDGSRHEYTAAHFVDASQFVYRSYYSNAPLARREFRAQLRLRSMVPDEACGVVALRTRGDAANLVSQAICVTNGWRLVTLGGVVPDASAATQLDLVVSGFSSTIHLRDAEIAEVAEGHESRPLLLAPTGVTMRLSWGTKYAWERLTGYEVAETVLPKFQGSSTIRLQVPELPAGTAIWSSLYVEDGTSVSITGERWTNGAAVPVNATTRVALFYGHPNFFAHAVSAAAIAVIVTSPTLLVAGLAATLASATVITTGSRTALAALAVALLIHVGLSIAATRSTRRSRWFANIGVGVLAILASGVLFVGFNGVRFSGLTVQGSATDSVADRARIWRFAWEEALENPLLGAGEPFDTAWSTAYPDEPGVTHAHNGLLDAMFRGGLPGALAVVWAFVGVLMMAARTRVSNAVVAGVGLVILNVTDATYMYASAIAPIIFSVLAEFDHQPPGTDPM